MTSNAPLSPQSPPIAAAESERGSATSGRFHGLFVLDPYWMDIVYPPDERARLKERVDFPDRAFSANDIRRDPSLLQETELLLSGWGGLRLDVAMLKAAPRLKAVFHGAGSVRELVTEAFWDRSILLSAAAAANAVPTAEFALAQIILSLKRAWRYARELQDTRDYPTDHAKGRQVAGAYRSTVGIVSLGMVGRRVRTLLKMLDIRVLAYDPLVDEEIARALDVECVSLEELFARSDVVTVHTPLLKETEGLIRGDLVSRMRPNATLINTARGAVVDESGLIRALRERPDIDALLDVTRIEPLPRDSPLYSLPNVVLTPHIAGSLNGECGRMGRMMIEEVERFLRGEKPCWRMTRERVAISA